MQMRKSLSIHHPRLTDSNLARIPGNQCTGHRRVGRRGWVLGEAGRGRLHQKHIYFLPRIFQYMEMGCSSFLPTQLDHRPQLALGVSFSPRCPGLPAPCPLLALSQDAEANETVPGLCALAGMWSRQMPEGSMALVPDSPSPSISLRAPLGPIHGISQSGNVQVVLLNFFVLLR